MSPPPNDVCVQVGPVSGYATRNADREAGCLVRVSKGDGLLEGRQRRGRRVGGKGSRGRPSPVSGAGESGRDERQLCVGKAEDIE